MKNPKVSIIIRTKNEERWMTSCLDSLKKQSYKNFEIILVDNMSVDGTIRKARDKGVKKIVKIKNYLPGKALNDGIKKSTGEYIVCLSAHCIPKDKNWLKNLIFPLLKNGQFGGVYGRQEPMNFSSHSDKRDLFLVFGLDERVQTKDTFFHNANSILRKSLWEKVKFDEKITNIEDRIWASKILKLGWKIFYEPKASVYHYHGIHQDGNKSRLRNVINIINKNNFGYNQGSVKPSSLNIVCIIPSKGDPKILQNNFLISKTIKMALKSKYIKKIYVSSDNQKTLNIAKKFNVGLIKRPKKYSAAKMILSKVQKFSLQKIENKFKVLPDLIVHLEETFPFREKGLIDKMILNLLNSNNDTLVAAKEETGCMWRQENNEYIRLDEGYLPRKFKKKTYIGLHGLCCITYPEFVRKSQLEGKKVGLYKIEDQFSFLEVRTTDKKFKKIF